MMDCKNALVEANGDFELAIENLRKKGQKVAAKRADRQAMEGVVIAKTNEDNSKAREKICESSVCVLDVLPKPSVSMNNTVNPSGSRTGSPQSHRPLVHAFTDAPTWKPVLSLSTVAPLS